MTRAAVETAAELLRGIIASTDWLGTGLACAPDLIAESTAHLTLRVNGLRHSGRGGDADMHPADDAILFNVSPLPTTVLEAGEVLRSLLVRALDHELREHLRCADGFVFDPHALRSADTVPGADRTFCAP